MKCDDCGTVRAEGGQVKSRCENVWSTGKHWQRCRRVAATERHGLKVCHICKGAMVAQGTRREQELALRPKQGEPSNEVS